MSEPGIREHEARELLKKMRYDTTALQARITDMFRVLDKLDLPDPAEVSCPHCAVSFRSQVVLSEHVYHSHDGPVPETWLRAEALAAPDTAPG